MGSQATYAGLRNLSTCNLAHALRITRQPSLQLTKLPELQQIAICSWGQLAGSYLYTVSADSMQNHSLWVFTVQISGTSM